MKATFLLVALGAIVSTADAVNLDTIAKSQLSVKTLARDGPTNGEMSEEEKDTLIQVLCPGTIQTSFSQTAGKSSTCNQGQTIATSTPKKQASLVQQDEQAGDTEIA